jgi:uncharacterized protein (DUF2345 family)
LLFDDIDGQGRAQLKSTYAGSELDLGYLNHVADNYRGSFRGCGAELRTDAYGVARAGAGLLVSSYKLSHGVSKRDTVGENAAGAALMKQAVAMADAFNSAAGTHQSVVLAAHLGTTEANKSILNATVAPLKAGATSLSGGGSTKDLQTALMDAKAKNIKANDGKVPHLTDPVIAVAAGNDFGVNAGQSFQLTNGEAAVLMCGQDSQVAVARQLRLQSKQVIGLLGSAIKPGEANVGLQLSTAKDAVEIQSQADVSTVQARNEVNLISANANIDWVAAKKLSLSTTGGASLVIEGGSIAVQCPGKIAVHAAKKSFLRPEKIKYAMPSLPRTDFESKKKFAFSS